MAETQRPETLFVRRRGYRWALVGAYLSMGIILAVTLTGVAFDGSGVAKITAFRSSSK